MNPPRPDDEPRHDQRLHHLVLSRAERSRIFESVAAELFAFGPIEPLLHDDSVTEVMVNRYNKVFAERNGRSALTDVVFEDDAHVRRMRGFDIANLTVIEGDTGLVLIDPLTTAEVARAALAHYFTHRPQKPAAQAMRGSTPSVRTSPVTTGIGAPR